MINTGTNTSYTGDGTSGLFLWGKQVEAGSVATSYIPTVASTVARTADEITLTSASSLIGQTQGRIIAKVNLRTFASADPRVIFYIDAGIDNQNSIFVYVNTDNKIGYLSIENNVAGVNALSSGSFTGEVEVDARYSANDFELFVNGVSVITGTSGAVPACSRILLGNGSPSPRYLNDNLLYFALFPTAV
jgi:hypothetical protein